MHNDFFVININNNNNYYNYNNKICNNIVGGNSYYFGHLINGNICSSNNIRNSAAVFGATDNGSNLRSCRLPSKMDGWFLAGWKEFIFRYEASSQKNIFSITPSDQVRQFPFLSGPSHLLHDPHLLFARYDC